jgi:hypothetical protein
VIATVQPAPKRTKKAPAKRAAPRESNRLVVDAPREQVRHEDEAPRTVRKAPEVVTKRRRLTIPKS